MVLNAAVILKDPKKIPQTMPAIEAQGERDGLPLKAIDWQKAAGLIGQFIDVARTVLYVAILIIFIIALVIINNALVMATLERVQEIGTLRAIGAQRRFILAMLVIEALVVGLVFGALGAGVGALAWSRSSARSASRPSRDVWFFFFSGPRLHPFTGHQQPRSPRFVDRAAGQRLLQLLPRLAGDAGHPAPGHAEGGVAMSKLFVDLTHRAAAAWCSTAGARCSSAPPSRAVTALLVLLNGLSTGVRETMIDTATTLSTGHVNVGGFFKVTAGQVGAGGDRLPEGAGGREEVGPRDGVRGPARPRLGQGRLRHRLDAGRDHRHRHQERARVHAGAAAQSAATSTIWRSRARS